MDTDFLAFNTIFSVIQRCQTTNACCSFSGVRQRKGLQECAGRDEEGECRRTDPEGYLCLKRIVGERERTRQFYQECDSGEPARRSPATERQ